MRDFIDLGETHSYSVDVAREIGIPQAVILESIKKLSTRNRKRGINQRDGKYWVEATFSDLKECFPYFSVNQIAYCVNKLKESGYIETGHFCENSLDRTTWYALTEKGIELLKSE